MSDIDNASGAAVGESDETSILDLDGEMESNEVLPTSDQAAADQRQEAQPEPEDQAAAGQEGEEQTHEDAAFDFEKLPSDTRFRLRDGSEVTAGELKKRYGELQELPRHRQEFEAQRNEFQARQAQFQQQEQFVSQVLPLTLQLAAENLPPEPDQSLLQTDPMLHYEMSNRRMQAIGRLQQLQAAHQQQMQQSRAQQQQSVQAYLQAERGRLLEAMPELREPKAQSEFLATITDTARSYGFSDEDVGRVMDHRLLMMARDAGRYRAMQAERAKVTAKVKDVPPVQAPQRRVTTAERQGREMRDRLEALRKTGSARAAEAVLSEWD